MYPSIHSPPLIQRWLAAAAAWEGMPWLPSPQPVHPGVGGSRGVPKPAKRHSPFSVSWVFPGTPYCYPSYLPPSPQLPLHHDKLDKSCTTFSTKKQTKTTTTTTTKPFCKETNKSWNECVCVGRWDSAGDCSVHNASLWVIIGWKSRLLAGRWSTR